MDELKLIFASNLIRLRTAAGMTQAELGEQLNYSDKSISKWERGEAIPDAAVLKRMSEIFGVTVDYLLDEHDAWQPAPDPADVRDRSHASIIQVALTGIVTLAVLVFVVLELLGKKPIPRYCEDHNDIVTCFDAGTAEALIGFCQGIQAASPVDSYAAPEPSPEPGYTDEVVMASGSFTQGSTIELSCDGPLRAPYTCYLQGGLNFAASRAGVLLAIQKAYFKE